MLRRIGVLVLGIIALGAALGGGIAIGLFAIDRTTVVEVDRIVTVPIEVEKIVTVPVEVERIVTVPVEVEKIVTVPVEVERIVTVQVEIEKIITVPVEVERIVTVPVEVEKIVRVVVTHVPPSPTPTSAPRVERSNWRYTSGRTGHGDRYVLADVGSSQYYSDNRYAEGPGFLSVACYPDIPQTDVYIHLDTFVASGNLYDTMRMVYTFDEEPSVTQWWRESVDNLATFAPNATEVQFALQAVQANTLNATITSFDGERTTVQFVLRGSEDQSHPVLRVLGSCDRI